MIGGVERGYRYSPRKSCVRLVYLLLAAAMAGCSGGTKAPPAGESLHYTVHPATGREVQAIGEVAQSQESRSPVAVVSVVSQSAADLDVAVGTGGCSPQTIAVTGVILETTGDLAVIVHKTPSKAPTPCRDFGWNSGLNVRLPSPEIFQGTVTAISG